MNPIVKIADLAALVAIRNHILTVVNDKSVTNRADYSSLNNIRVNLDKKFVELVKTLDIDTCLVTTPIVIKEVAIDKPVLVSQLELPFNEDPVKEESEKVGFIKYGNSGKLVENVVDDTLKPIVAPEVSKNEKLAEQDDELISALQREKEKLKKQGRSNKRVSKE